MTPAYILAAESALLVGAVAARTTLAQSERMCAGRTAMRRETATPTCSPAWDVCGKCRGTGRYTARTLSPPSVTCADAQPARDSPLMGLWTHDPSEYSWPPNPEQGSSHPSDPLLPLASPTMTASKSLAGRGHTSAGCGNMPVLQNFDLGFALPPSSYSHRGTC